MVPLRLLRGRGTALRTGRRFAFCAGLPPHHAYSSTLAFFYIPGCFLAHATALPFLLPFRDGRHSGGPLLVAPFGFLALGGYLLVQQRVLHLFCAGRGGSSAWTVAAGSWDAQTLL
jgi:hypothetical protein